MMSEIELQYNNRARISNAAEIVQQWSRDAAGYRARAMDAGRAELNITYGSSTRQVVEMFWPENDSSEHIAVFIHGGYWQLFEPALFSHLAAGPNARGIPVAMVGYDLCPNVSLGEIVTQTVAACVFLRRKFQRRMVLMGHSAGGHLTAAMLAHDFSTQGADDPALIAAGLAISGVFELAPLLRTSMNDNLRLNEASARELSPVYWTPRAGATIDAWVGGNESEEFLRQSKEFAAAWAKRGAHARFEVVPEANHFNVIGALMDPRSAMVNRLSVLAGASTDPDIGHGRR